MVEVTFTVSPRVRRIAAHNPHDLSPTEYFRQIYWGSGLDIPDDFDALFETIDHRGARPAGRATRPSCRCSCLPSS